MLNKLLSFIRQHELISPGDRVVCAVSGGADSVALLFALYLLREQLGITLAAAHFNHHLRPGECGRDERIVRHFCERYDIPLTVGHGDIVPGKKGLEAAARDARYGFLRALPGKIATAHTADDNAETVLMHLIRGTGLRGLGGIAPVNGNVIRPMLSVTRQEVEAFADEWHLTYVFDSSNGTDAFLRNRLRHHVMPLLTGENPALAQNLSAMALQLRLDSEFLDAAGADIPFTVPNLRAMHPALRCRRLEAFLKASGVREPESAHIALAENLVFSQNPSARAQLPGGITVTRRYDMLEVLTEDAVPEPVILPCPGQLEWGGYTVTCCPAGEILNTRDTFTLAPVGPILLRSRRSGDSLRLPGGAKSLKKLFIDRKIPAFQRPLIPVLSDDRGVLAAHCIGPNLDRVPLSLPAVRIHIEKKDNGGTTL